MGARRYTSKARLGCCSRQPAWSTFRCSVLVWASLGEVFERTLTELARALTLKLESVEICWDLLLLSHGNGHNKDKLPPKFNQPSPELLHTSDCQHGLCPERHSALMIGSIANTLSSVKQWCTFCSVLHTSMCRLSYKRDARLIVYWPAFTAASSHVLLRPNVAKRLLHVVTCQL